MWGSRHHWESRELRSCCLARGDLQLVSWCLQIRGTTMDSRGWGQSSWLACPAVPWWSHEIRVTYFRLFNVYVCLAHTHGNHMPASALGGQKRMSGQPGTGVSGWVLWCWCEGPSPGLLEEHQVLVTTEASLRLPQWGILEPIFNVET